MKKTVSLLLILSLLSALFCSCQAVTDTVRAVDDETVNIIKPKVTFVTNGGTAVQSQTTKVVKTEPKTTREHYLFDGWYLDKSFKSLAVFPLSVEYDTTLYAKWLKIYDTATCKATTISGKKDYASAATYNVSPSDFDLAALAERNLKLEITVTYKVKYKKSYNAPFDIGYAGSPKYEVFLLGEDLKGAFQEDLSTTTSAKERSIKMCTSASYFENNIISLTFSTNNIQNLIIFDDIQVVYQCGQ